MKDERGNPTGTASGAALAHAETALWRMVSFFDAPLADIDAALAEDPRWMLPHVMRANFLLSLTEPSLMPDVRAALQRAEELAPHAADRERAHLAAAQACAEGDWHGACAQWNALLDVHPRDLHALQWAHLFDFYRGDAANLRDRPARSLQAWDRQDPLRPYLLGMYAFGLEECHEHAAAEATGREAVAGEAKVPWATHAVAHVMEMQGRHTEGRAWLHERETDWAVGNGFACHHWWHLALFQLEAMDLDAALATYDARLAGSNAEITLQRLDAAALLWRLRLLGADVGERWDGLAAGWDFSGALVGHSAFNDVHALLVRIGQGRLGDAQRLLATAERRAEERQDSNAAMAREVGLPLMRGLLAHATGRAAQALELIAPIRRMAHTFGGSHAQRDLIAQTLLAAAADARAANSVTDCLQERLRAKPGTPLTEHWRQRLL